MDVNIYEAGEESGVAEVEDFGGGRVLDGETDFDNTIVLDEDFSGGKDFASLNIE